MFRTDTPTDRSWKVRFYAEGDPPHIGTQSTLQINASALISEQSRARRRSRRLQAQGGGAGLFGVVVAAYGTSPFLPSDTDDAVLVVSDVTNETDVQVVDFTPPVHVCGNGIRSTAEACDDNNTLGGDGCDSLCRLEAGWLCTSSLTEGSGVGGVDTCAPICGDGLRVIWAEACDDNGTLSGDGCSASCTV